MATTREFTQDELSELLDGASEIDSRAWRHGRLVRYLFEHDGSHWAAWIHVHHDEGVQEFGPVTATQVHMVARTVQVWEPVP